MQESDLPIVIIGGGFSGLAAAWELSKKNFKVEIFEASDVLGGLAGTFEIQPGIRVEKFYHHWFTSDTAVLNLVEELGLSGKLKRIPSRTALFHVNSIFRLSSPWDLLRFNVIPLMDRVRTGLLALYARQVKNWKRLETIRAIDWIRQIGGSKAFEVVWQPLLRGKFGVEAENVSAVWFWNKLKLRGSSRGKKGREELIYFEGSFGSLIDELQKALESRGVKIHTSVEVQQIMSDNREIKGVLTTSGFVPARVVLSTVPLPVFLKLTPEIPPDYRDKASRIRFLGNVCLVLRLSRSLSETYWLNVADPDFPFVGVIEHTNLDSTENYAGEHLAYISKYLPVSEDLFKKSDEELYNYCIPYIQKIFPEFNSSWVKGYRVWKANYSQPVITREYSKLIPEAKTPIQGLWLCTMAQVYPEDRGTNYAVREGRKVAKEMLDSLL